MAYERDATGQLRVKSGFAHNVFASIVPVAYPAVNRWESLANMFIVGSACYFAGVFTSDKVRKTNKTLAQMHGVFNADAEA